MATEEVRAFHEQGRAIANRGVMNLMANNASKGYRREHPQFRGLPANSTGSRNVPFLTHTNQARLPFEVPVMSGAGNAGALWNPSGREYAKAALTRRAMDIQAQQEMLPEPTEAIPGQEAIPASAAEAKLDELRGILTIIMNGLTSSYAPGRDTIRFREAIENKPPTSVSLGQAAVGELGFIDVESTQTINLFLKAQRLLTELGPSLDEATLLDIDEALDNIERTYRAFDVIAGSNTSNLTELSLDYLSSMRKYIERMVDGIRRGVSEPRELKALSKNAKKAAAIGELPQTTTKLKALVKDIESKGKVVKSARALLPITSEIKKRQPTSGQLPPRGPPGGPAGGPPPPPRGPPGGPPRPPPPSSAPARGPFPAPPSGRSTTDSAAARAMRRADAAAAENRAVRALANADLALSQNRAIINQIQRQELERRQTGMAQLIDTEETNLRRAAFSGREAAVALAERLRR